MEKSVKITLIIVAGILILAGISGYFILQSKASENTVTAEGFATIKVNPDLAAIYFRAETIGSSAKEAKDRNAEIANDAVRLLIKAGIPENSIQTLDFNVYPDYSWIDGKQVFKGYKAVQSFKVKLEAQYIDKAGATIDAGVDAGALIDHIDFELSTAKQNEYKAEALKQASQDAKTKAEAIASGLNKKVGKVISVHSIDFGYYPWQIYRYSEESNVAEAKATFANIKPSEKEINARVSVVFEII